MDIKNNLLINAKLNSNYVHSKMQENSEKAFSEVLFTKHAKERIETRDINLTDEQINRLNKGISNAKEKGIKESLVLIDNIALIVSIKNNKVITATKENKDNVFTNIDGAVIV